MAKHNEIALEIARQGIVLLKNDDALPLAMPAFDVVTGVSTGALIAPFAFLGDAQSLNTIVELYG